MGAVGLILAVLGLLLAPSAARAHTDLESSLPADEEVVDQRVDQVVLTFTAPVTPVADRIAALNADGVEQMPVAIDTDDGRVFTVRFDPVLAGGQVGFRWAVQAADGHILDGAFAFTVNAAPPTTPAPTTTSAPTTTAAPTTIASTTVAADTTIAETSTTTTSLRPATTDVPATVAAAGPADPAAGGGQALDEFLADDGSQRGETTALLGRILSLLGVAVALGSIVFVATTLRGSGSEIRLLLSGAVALAVVLMLGAVVEYVGIVQIGDDSFGSAWTSTPGLAPALRFGGGLVLIVGLILTIRRHEFGSTGPARALSAAVVDDLEASPSPRPADDGPSMRWTPSVWATPIAVGAALIVMSFWFDGHTVTKGFRPLHIAVDTVHVAAASVWVGGVVALCTIVWSRHRRGAPSGAAQLVVRFSRIGAAALGAVVLAGLVMAVMVLDSFGELTGSQWGQTLLVKTGAVAIAIGIGAYNHFRMVPALDAEPDSAILAARLRSTIAVEAVVLCVVVLVTAWLVGAAT